MARFPSDCPGFAVSRRLAGQRAQRLGAAWEAQVRCDLSEAVDAGLLSGFQQTGPLIQRTGPGGRKLVIIEETAPVDFDCWSDGGAWRFEAKATSSLRWPLSQLEAHQSQQLTTWHRPHLSRFAGVALRFDSAEPVEVWLSWDVLAPLWVDWARGRAARGMASLTAARAIELGRLWSPEVFLCE